MNWRINESGVSATIENIEWERIHLILTVRLHIDGQKTYDIDKMVFWQSVKPVLILQIN